MLRCKDGSMKCPRENAGSPVKCDHYLCHHNIRRGWYGHQDCTTPHLCRARNLETICEEVGKFATATNT